MTSRTPPAQPPEVTASKVSAGLSPRLIALGLAVVLVAVVYVGVTGQGPAPAATAAPTDRAIGAAPAASGPAFPGAPDAYPGVYEILDREGAGSSSVGLAVNLTISGGRTALAALCWRRAKPVPRGVWSATAGAGRAEATLEL